VGGTGAETGAEVGGTGTETGAEVGGTTDGVAEVDMVIREHEMDRSYI